jgi:biofilm PGA synthesis protein PgaA
LVLNRDFRYNKKVRSIEDSACNRQHRSSWVSFGMKLSNFHHSQIIRLCLIVLAAAAWSALGQTAMAASGEEDPHQALAQLNARLAAHPGDVEALAERARVFDAAGQPMSAFLDRREILRQRPGDAGLALLAASDLADAGAPQAAAAFLQQYPAVSGEGGTALARRLAGDAAARRIRWGWAEPVFDPAERRHEAVAAIAALEAMHRQDPGDARATGDLLLAYRLADRMADVIALWEHAVHREDAPYWLRNTAADAYLALHRPAEAEALYRSFAGERAGSPEPWLGIYWSAIEQRHYGDAAAALERLAKVPGQELTAAVQQGWLLLFQDRTVAGQAFFEALFDQHPGDPRVREGLATAYLWQGSPRRGLAAVEELLARTTLDVPRVDNPAARIARAGALSALGDLAAARRQADDLAALYPENVHARRLRRDVHLQLAPEVRLEGRYETSDRGLGESWSQLEVSAPLGTRARLAAGGYDSRSDDQRYARGDVREAYLGLSLRPGRWLSLGAEAAWDVSGKDLGRGAAMGARLALLPDDRWRIDLGAAHDAWRDLPLRARAAGIVADTYDAGLSYTAGTRWDARLGGGRSALTDDNRRTWGLAAAHLLVREGPLYRATFGAEVYASENRRSDVAYFSPARDRSASLSHRSEWVAANAPGHRHSFSLLANLGIYDQQGFASGPVGGLWLESDWDLSGRTVLVVGAGARSQLYDGSRELDPKLYLTVRRRL